MLIKEYLPKELVEVVAIPTAEEALNDKKVKDILSKTKTFTRDEFTKVLLLVITLFVTMTNSLLKLLLTKLVRFCL